MYKQEKRLRDVLAILAERHDFDPEVGVRAVDDLMGALARALASARAEGFAKARETAASALSDEAVTMERKYVERRHSGGLAEPDTVMMIALLRAFSDRIRAMQDEGGQ